MYTAVELNKTAKRYGQIDHNVFYCYFLWLGLLFDQSNQSSDKSRTVSYRRPV